MKILFIKTGMGSNRPVYFDLGMASISAVLKENGHETSFFYLNNWSELKNLYRRVLLFKPDFIGFGSPTCTFDIFVKLSILIKKKYPDIFLILGSHHPTLCPDESISMGSFDAISLGEGEYSILETVEKYKKTKKWYEGIKGMWFKIDGKIIKNPNRGMIENLDELPDPDWEMFAKEGILYANWGGFNINKMQFMLSRGCPFNCTFCCNTAIKKFYGCSTVRRLSVDRAISQILRAVKTYRIDAITFNDDILTANKEWSKEFLNKYKTEINLPFDCNLRVGPFSSREMLTLLKEAGCVEVKFGVESGNNDIREKILNRKMTNEHIVETFKIATELSLKTFGYFMIGLPEESPNKFIDTINLAINSDIDVSHVAVFQPYVNTKLYDYCIEKKYMDDSRKEILERHDTVLNLPTFERRDILYFFNNFEQTLKYGKSEGSGLKKIYQKLCFSLYLVYPSKWLYLPAKALLFVIRMPVLFFVSVKNAMYE